MHSGLEKAAPDCSGRRHVLCMDRCPARTPFLSPIAGPSPRRSAADPPAVLALLANRCPDRSRRHHDKHLLRGGSAIRGSEFHPIPPGDYSVLLDAQAKQDYIKVNRSYRFFAVRLMLLRAEGIARYAKTTHGTA